MASMNVSLPDQMKEWVENQIESGKYHNASEYVRDLIRKDQNDKEKLEALRAAIQAGMDSGVSGRTADEIFAAAKNKAKKK